MTRRYAGSVTELDPRVAASSVVSGPADLVGNTLVRVEEVTITGQAVHLPASIPGVPQYVAVARAEAQANALWPRLMDALDGVGRSRTSPTPHS